MWLRGDVLNNKQLDDVYKLYYNFLYIYSLSLCNDVNDAKDLVQETFLKAFISLPSADGNVKYWLVKVLRNLYYNEKRYKKKFVELSEQHLNSIKSDEDVFKSIVMQDDKRRLLKMIQNLPINQRDVLMYSIYFQLNDDEISKILNLSCINIRKIRSRAKEKLVKLMEDQYEW